MNFKKALKMITPYGLVLFFQKCKNYKVDRNSALSQWLVERGDETYRLDYPFLNPNSTVVDLGGYKGEWSRDIYAKYSTNIFIFEPIPSYAEALRKFFQKNNKVTVLNKCVCLSSGIVQMAIAENSSSVFKGTGDLVDVKACKISDFFTEFNVECIDLLKINVEGSEYEILEDLFVSNKMHLVKNFQIQFHNFVDDADKKIERARELLSETHQQVWNFEFVWEGWTLKGKS
ncbi:FkbM family methyltransferase [Desulfovibrio sp. QI0442]